MNNEITSAQLFSYLAGHCTAVEQEAVEAWINASEANRREFEEHRQLYNIAGAVADVQQAPVTASLEALKQRLPRPPGQRPFFRAMNRVAAILFWPLLAAGGLLLLWPGRKAPERLAEMRTAAGVVTRYVLPDSTVVWLNGGTTLRYPQRFAGPQRQVWLEGEAYFEVAAAAARPFVVETGTGVKVKVLGTRFNVNAYTEDSTADVSLVSGAVKVEQAAAPQRALVLQPGQKASSRPGAGWELSTVHTDQDIGWVQGKLVLRDMPLETVVKKLSRRYNADILLADERLKEYRYTVTVTDESIDQVLDLFRLTSPVRYEIGRPGRQPDNSYGRKRIVLYMLKK